MRVMIVSCSYLLYEYLLNLKNVLGLVLGLVILSSAGFVLVLVLRSLASINITAKYVS